MPSEIADEPECLRVCVFLFGLLLVGLQSGKDHDVQHRHFISLNFNDKVGMRLLRLLQLPRIVVGRRNGSDH